MSKELSASAKSLSDRSECFIEVYIDNRSLFVIVYRDGYATVLAIVAFLFLNLDKNIGKMYSHKALFEMCWCHDNLHNDIHFNDKSITRLSMMTLGRYIDIQQNDYRKNNTQHKGSKMSHHTRLNNGIQRCIYRHNEYPYA